MNAIINDVIKVITNLNVITMNDDDDDDDDDDEAESNNNELNSD